MPGARHPPRRRAARRPAAPPRRRRPRRHPGRPPTPSAPARPCWPCAPRSPRPSSARTPPSPGWSSPCSAAATCCSRACPASPRRCSCAPWPRRSTLDTKRVQFTPDLMPGDVTGSLVYDARIARVRLPRRAGLHQPAARRRDQPHAAQDPGRAARGDGGAAGHRRRRSRARCPTRSSSPRPRTRSSTRAPTRCPRPSSTGSCSSSTLPLPPRDDEVQVLRRHASGFDPRDLAAAGIRPVADRRRPRRRRAAVREVAIVRRGRGYVVDIARATRRVAVARARRLAARRHRAAGDRRAWAWLSGRDYVTPDDVKALAHADAAAPGRAAARGRAGGRRRRRRARQRARLGAGPAADGDHLARPCVLALLGLAPVAVWPHASTVRWWLLARASCSWPLDVLLASRPRAAEHRARRAHPGAARRDHDEQPAGSPTPRGAACAACCATPGRRRPGAVRCRARRSPCRRASGVRLTTDLRAHPARRPAGRPGHRARRSARSGWPRGSGRSRCPGRSGCCRRSPRASTCRAGSPGCASSTGAPRCASAARAPSSTPCASTSTATTCAPSTGAPPPGASTWWCAPGGPSAPPGRHRARHLAHQRRPGRRRPAAGRRDGRRAAARRARRPRRRPGGPARRRPGGPRADLAAPTAPGCCTTRSRPSRPSSRGWSRPTGRRWPPRSCGSAPTGRWSCCSPRWSRSAIEEGLLPVLPALAAHHRVVVASVSDPALATMRAGAHHHRRGLRRGRGRAHGRAAAAHGIRAGAARRRRRRRRARRAAGAPGRPLPDAQAPGPALSRGGSVDLQLVTVDGDRAAAQRPGLGEGEVRRRRGRGSSRTRPAGPRVIRPVVTSYLAWCQGQTRQPSASMLPSARSARRWRQRRPTAKYSPLSPTA